MTAAAPHVPRVRALTALLTFVAAVVVCSWATVPYTVGVFHDDGVYALLAQSIARGNGFHYSHLPGNPAATHYPPLYPLFLAAAWRASPEFPANVGRLLELNAVLVGIAALGWLRFATLQLKWHARSAAAAAFVATLASPVLALAGALLSEPLFMALLFPALLLGERAADDRRPRAVILAGTIIGVLMLVRTHALALLIGLILVLVIKRRARDAAIALTIAVAVQLPWFIWTHWASPPVAAPLEGAYGSYVAWFVAGIRDGGLAFVIATARTNVAEMWLLLQDRFSPGMGVLAATCTAGIALAAMITGGASMWRRAPVTVVFVLAYLGIVKVWPYTPWRFVWAVWPLLFLLALEGFRAGRSLRGKWRTGITIAAALPALAFVRTELHSYATRGWRTPARMASAQITPVLDWVNANTNTGDVILVEGEQVVALYTGRRAAPPIAFSAREYLTPPNGRDEASRLMSMLNAVPSRFVILLSPVMVAHADSLASLHRVATVATGVVYEVRQ